VWLQRYIDAPPQGAPELPEILRRASAFASIEGDYEEAEALAKRSLTLYYEAMNEEGVLEALHALAVNETRRGNYGGAERLYGDIATRCMQAGHERAAVTSNANRASIKLKAGDIAGAEILLAECLKRAELLGDEDVFGTVVALNGVLAYKRREWGEADSRFRHALAIKNELKSEFGIAEISAALAAACAHENRCADAADFACNSLTIALELSEPHLVVDALEACSLAGVYCGAFDCARDALRLSRTLRRIHSILEKTALGSDELETALERHFGAPLDEAPAHEGDWRAAALAIGNRLRNSSEASLI
jgi:tetratricopeptide (TPR) repeat protein